jgi:hypothetical protein
VAASGCGAPSGAYAPGKGQSGAPSVPARTAANQLSSVGTALNATWPGPVPGAVWLVDTQTGYCLSAGGGPGSRAVGAPCDATDKTQWRVLGEAA